MIRWQHAALAAATAGTLCLAAAPAAATTTASASLGPLSLQLIDLDPLDGVAPSISFFGESGLAGSVATASATEYLESQSSTRYGVTAWQATTATAETALVTASASVSGAGATPSGKSLEAFGSIAPLGDAGRAQAIFAARAEGPLPGSFLGSFLVSANTYVIVTGLAAVYGVATDSLDPAFPDRFRAFARLEFSSGSSPDDYLTSSDGLFISRFPSGLGDARPMSDGRLLSASFTNLTNADLAGTLTASVSVSGISFASPPPVPEPAAVLMMLAGLAALGVIVRRRRAA